jgi:hypothetical protein
VVDPVSILLSQGPLGIIAGIILWLYLAEKKRNHDLNKYLDVLREENYRKIDEVRQQQISREQEVAKTLDEYGRSVVLAVDQTAYLAKELRRMTHGQQPR